MATKSAGYDNSTYLAVVQVNGGALSGSGGVTQRFAAACTCLLKSVQTNYVTAGTAADAKNLIIVSQGTSTTTTALHTRTAAVGPVNNVATNTLNQGDSVWVVKGADATEVSSVTFETVISPGANITA